MHTNLLVLVGDEVNAEGELVNSGTLAAEIKNADLGIGHTAAEARLGVRLVLAVAVATSGTATHCDLQQWRGETRDHSKRKESNAFKSALEYRKTRKKNRKHAQ